MKNEQNMKEKVANMSKENWESYRERVSERKGRMESYSNETEKR